MHKYGEGIMRAARAASVMKLAAAAVAAGIALVVLGEMFAGPSHAITDFTAFYCAGTAVRDHRDPYHAMPLGACEQRLGSAGIYGVKDVVLPAPLPPYALGPLAALATLPYGAALVAWRLLLIVAIILTAVALRQATGLPWLAVVLALVMIDLLDDVLQGQPVSLVVAALALGAWALKRGADRIAGALACVAMLEPHLGLPACLSLFAYRPGTRLPLLGGAALGALLSVTVVPVSLSIEYIIRVLPQHAAAEVSWFWQYSLAHALYVLGASTSVSIMAGSLSYVVMVILAMVLAPRVSARLHEPGLLVALPPALATLGGSYIHISQVASAVPAALLLAAQTPGTAARLGAMASVLLTISGIQFGIPGYAAITAGIGAGLASVLFRPRMLAAATAAGGVLLLGLALHGLQPIRGVSSIPPPVSQSSANVLAEDSWSRFVRAEDPGPRMQRLELLAKAPTWIGLALICAAGIAAAFTSKPK